MADSKITALTALTAADPANDMLPVVDVSDTSMAASGTTKRISINNILACSPSATLASATISGALTAGGNVGFGTTNLTTISGYNTLKINNATNGAIIDLALGDAYKGRLVGNSGGLQLETSGSLAIVLSSGGLPQYRVGTLGVFDWYDGAGGTRMTLNATGLGVGIAPSNSKLSVYGTGDQTDETATLSVGDTAAGGMRLYAGVNNTNEYVYIGSVKSGSGYRTLKLQPNGGNAIICLSITPPTLAVGGDMVFNLTSNTNLRISVRGTDGTTRVANITLA